MIKLKNIVKEIERLQSRSEGPDAINYNDTIKYYFDEYSNKNKVDDLKKINNYYFDWINLPEENEEIILMYNEQKRENPIAFAKLKKLKDSFKVRNIAINPSYAGKSLAQNIYDYILSKYNKIYSDITQTPQSRKSWIKLSKRYKVKGYNINDDVLFDVSPNKDGTELESNNPNYILYTDENSKESKQSNYQNYLVIIK